MLIDQETRSIHHPLIDALLAKVKTSSFAEVNDPAMIQDFVGVLSRSEFFTLRTPEVPYEFREPKSLINGIASPIDFGPEYFELLDLIESVQHAKMNL